MENNQTELMAKAPVAKAIVKMSLPVILGMMVQVLYNLVDTFFIGMLKDEVQLAAANITTPIFMIQMAIATIVSTGAASFISRSIGEKNNDRANRTLTTGIVICTGLAIVLMAVGLLNLKSLITALGASAEVFPYASQYVGIMLLGSIPVMLNYAGGQLLRSEGAMMPSITGMMIGTVINMVLDPLFIFAFDMGIGGAAVATVLGNLGAAAYYGWYYLSGKALLKIRRKDVSRDKRIWKEIFTIGVPACMSQFLVSVAMIILNNQAKMYGDSVLAGMGISSKLMFIGTFVFMGFAAGCQPLIGYNYGANSVWACARGFEDRHGHDCDRWPHFAGRVLAAGTRPGGHIYASGGCHQGGHTGFPHQHLLLRGAGSPDAGYHGHSGLRQGQGSAGAVAGASGTVLHPAAVYHAKDPGL
ncbi:MAG: MATE family efflux transporter [Clostridiales bacterium]|nr:MATE family efflux transporter [Clostridiales bacterium]